MVKATFSRIISPLGFLQIAIILLALITALIHLQHGLTMGGGGAGHMGQQPSAGFSGKAPAGGFPTPSTGSAGTPQAGFSGTPQAGFSGTPQAGFSGTPRAGFSGGPSGGPSGGSSVLASLPIPLSTLFILNFIGYIVLVIALYLRPLQPFQRIIRWLLIVFTAVTILAWFLIAGSHPDLLGVVDKVIEGVLILLLLIEEWQQFKFKSRQEPHAPLAGESAPVPQQ